MKNGMNWNVVFDVFKKGLILVPKIVWYALVLFIKLIWYITWSLLWFL